MTVELTSPSKTSLFLIPQPQRLASIAGFFDPLFTKVTGPVPKTSELMNDSNLPSVIRAPPVCSELTATPNVPEPVLTTVPLPVSFAFSLICETVSMTMPSDPMSKVSSSKPT